MSYASGYAKGYVGDGAVVVLNPATPGTGPGYGGGYVRGYRPAVGGGGQNVVINLGHVIGLASPLKHGLEGVSRMRAAPEALSLLKS